MERVPDSHRHGFPVPLNVRKSSDRDLSNTEARGSPERCALIEVLVMDELGGAASIDNSGIMADSEALIRLKLEKLRLKEEMERLRTQVS